MGVSAGSVSAHGVMGASGGSVSGPGDEVMGVPAASMLDDGVYQCLADLVSADSSERGPGHVDLRPGVEQALCHEARLLDDRQYRLWLQRFTEDCIYWIPLEVSADPRTKVSYLLDDRRRMVDRIGLLETGWAHAQEPPSRTCRTVSNVEAWPLGGGDTLARCSTVVWEHRKDRLTPFASRNDYVLASLGDRWSIRYKIVRLVDCSGDVRKFSFVL